VLADPAEVIVGLAVDDAAELDGDQPVELEVAVDVEDGVAHTL
jgi:hypothetical protein